MKKTIVYKIRKLLGLVPFEETIVERFDLERSETDGGIEYSCTTSSLLYRELPAPAKHVTGKSCSYSVVRMDPKPAEFVVGYDEDGEPVSVRNKFDARGYAFYSEDNRLDEAEQELGVIRKVKQIEWRKVLTMAVVGAVVLGVIIMFLR